MLGVIYAGHGDEIPVSVFPADGTFPTGTAKWKSVTSRSTFLCGIRRPVFSVANALWCAHMP